MSTAPEVSAGSRLATCDLHQLGARSGLLWTSPTSTVVGLGGQTRLPLTRPNDDGAAQARLRDLGGVGFASLPFDPEAPGELIVPDVAIVELSGERTLVGPKSSDVDSAVAEVERLLNAPSATHPQNVFVSSVRRPGEWRDAVVGAAIARIDQGDAEKIVLARELLLLADEDFCVEPVVLSLISRFPEANVFAIDGFVGASPELLVARQDRVVSAHPLAGTATRLADPADDAEQIVLLQMSSKDRVEHRITIDWLLAELLPYCSYVDAEPDPSVLSLANVHHLATRVEGMLSEPAASVLDLVGAVHPTPALGGAPQSAALQIISELEGMDRGRYGGPTGWVDAEGNGEFAVSVRTAQLDGALARVCAGVGVVAASDPESELAETQAKFRAMLGSLLA